MALDSRMRRMLAEQGNRLKVHATVRAEDLSDAVIQHVRSAFANKELIKVRIGTDDREEFARAAGELAAGVPCELVRRVGRVALLYRPTAKTPGEVRS